MGAYEATKVVFARLQALDPNHAPNIIGMLLAEDINETDMIRLASGPDNILHSIIAKVRTNLISKPFSLVASWGSSSDRGKEASFTVDKVGCDGVETLFPKDYDWRLPVLGGNHHQSDTPEFLHGLSNGDRVVANQETAFMHAKAATEQPQQMASIFAISPSSKDLSLQFQQHQSGSQRGVTMHLCSEDMQKYSSRPPQIDQSNLTGNCSARQIYLTFPANSIFSKEDVCNYFSMYGMVRDVRIPYQEKRMFGFVTFACPKTVQLILARGNPHYICDARVLVKPYKEKDKVPNKFSKFQQTHPRDFASYTFPNRLIYSRGLFDLQQHQIGSRILYRDMPSHEEFLRMKLDEQQHATKRFLMRLQLLSIQNRDHHLNSPMGSNVPIGQVDNKDNVNGNDNPVHLEDGAIRDDSLKNELAMWEIAAATISTEGKHIVNSREEGKREFGAEAATPNDGYGFQERGMELSLPDSPFSSPTKASIIATEAHTSNINNNSPHMVASSLCPQADPLSCPATTNASPSSA